MPDPNPEFTMLDGHPRATYIDAEGAVLTITLTDEGIIIDAFTEDDHLGTSAMTYDEWVQRLAGEWLTS